MWTDPLRTTSGVSDVYNQAVGLTDSPLSSDLAFRSDASNLETTLTLQRLHGSRRQQYLLESQDVRLQGEAGVSSLSERYKDWWWPKVLTAEMGGGYHSDCCTCRVPGVLDVLAVSAGAPPAQTDRIGPLSATTWLSDPPVPQMHPYAHRTQKQTKMWYNYYFTMDRTSKITKDPSCQASDQSASYKELNSKWTCISLALFQSTDGSKPLCNTWRQVQHSGAMQSANSSSGNWGISILLKDTSTCR